jgi:hypothetical protein
MFDGAAVIDEIIDRAPQATSRTRSNNSRFRMPTAKPRHPTYRGPPFPVFPFPEPPFTMFPFRGPPFPFPRPPFPMFPYPPTMFDLVKQHQHTRGYQSHHQH